MGDVDVRSVEVLVRSGLPRSLFRLREYATRDLKGMVHLNSYCKRAALWKGLREGRRVEVDLSDPSLRRCTCLERIPSYWFEYDAQRILEVAESIEAYARAVRAAEQGLAGSPLVMLERVEYARVACEALKQVVDRSSYWTNVDARAGLRLALERIEVDEVRVAAAASARLRRSEEREILLEELGMREGEWFWVVVPRWALNSVTHVMQRAIVAFSEGSEGEMLHFYVPGAMKEFLGRRAGEGSATLLTRDDTAAIRETARVLWDQCGSPEKALLMARSV